MGASAAPGDATERLAHGEESNSMVKVKRTNKHHAREKDGKHEHGKHLPGEPSEPQEQHPSQQQPEDREIGHYGTSGTPPLMKK